MIIFISFSFHESYTPLGAHLQSIRDALVLTQHTRRSGTGTALWQAEAVREISHVQRLVILRRDEQIRFGRVAGPDACPALFACALGQARDGNGRFWEAGEAGEDGEFFAGHKRNVEQLGGGFLYVDELGLLRYELHYISK